MTRILAQRTFNQPPVAGDDGARTDNGHAGNPSHPPVAGGDVTRTDNGQTVSVFTSGNDFDPDGDDFFVSRVDTPPHGAVEGFGNGFNYTPNPRFSRVPTIPARPAAASPEPRPPPPAAAPSTA